MCKEHGLGVITWAPMGMGVLAGRYTDETNLPDDSRAVLRGGFYADRITRRGIDTGIEFAKIARRVGLSAAQLAVVWVKEQPGITAPLIGPKTMDQLSEFLPVMETGLDDETARPATRSYRPVASWPISTTRRRG